MGNHAAGPLRRRIFATGIRPFVIDPYLVQAEDGTVIRVVDKAPGRASGKREWLEENAFYGNHRIKAALAAFDGDTRVSNLAGGTEGETAIPLGSRAGFYDPEGCRT